MAGPAARMTGISGESEAEAFFRSQGFDVLERNFRYGKRGELDLILRKGDLFVFAEVKTRTGASFGGGLYSVTHKKMSRMQKTAQYYIASHLTGAGPEFTFRFDLLSVTAGGIDWIKDIIR